MSGFQNYARQAMREPQLDHEEMLELGHAWRDQGDIDARDRLVRAHLKLALKMAHTAARRYQMPVEDLVQEANLGLLRAARGYDPERGFTFATYAYWWIREAISSFVLDNASIVKFSGTNRQRSGLQAATGLRREIAAELGTATSDPMVSEVAAERLGRTPEEFRAMECWLAGDVSLQQQTPTGRELGDLIADPSAGPDEIVGERSRVEAIERCVNEAIGGLCERERMVVSGRRLRDQDDRLTLGDIGATLGLSKERVRQIENGALRKIAARLPRSTHQLVTA